MSDTKPRQKVAILGGGVGAMVAAFELTNPVYEGSANYDVTVYQMGWRLGGKCASGRNRDDHNRIQEHGLHIWLGFYYNGFSVLKACLDELNREPGTPLARIEDALKPQNFITAMDPFGDRWSRWDVAFPPLPGSPWEASAPSAWTYARMAIGWMVNMLGPEEPAPHTWEEQILNRVRLTETEVLAGFTGLHLAHDFMQSLGEWVQHHPASGHDKIIQFVEHFAERLRAGIAGGHFADHDEARRMSQLFDLIVSAVLGLFREGVIAGKKSFSDLDDLELRQFLTTHGCQPDSLNCPALMAYYDIAFAFKDGINDAEHMNTGAGSAVQALLRMCFGYKGGFMWEMQAGMGDTIFSPLYEVLRKRGVKFNFFHKVRTLEASSDGTSIERIRIGRQVDVIGGDYHPLFNVQMAGGTLPCWPSEPFYDQLVQGQALRASGQNLESDWSGWTDVGAVELQAGRDFDRVLLGIPVGALKSICAPLLDERIPAASRWRNMLERVETVQTQAMQLWFDRTIWDLGWAQRIMPSQTDTGLERTVLDGYADPYNSWADMTHLLAAETWPDGPRAPQSLVYLCGTLPEQIDPPMPPAGTDPAFPATQLARVRQQAVQWLSEHTAAIWPAAAIPSSQGLDWNRLVTSTDVQGPARLDSQWLRANVDGTERYVLSVAGSSRYRMKAGDTGFSNLVIAGDWIDTGFNVGCVEAATMSGRQASRAICGYPQHVPGEEQGNPSRRSPTMQYIVRSGDEEMPLPYTFTGLTIRSFPLEADTTKLQDLCDRYLNIAPPEILEYRPLGGLVYMQVATYQSLASDSNPEGFFSENEISFNVLVARGRRVNGRWQAMDLAFYFPFIFVDNPWAIATGREVFGYPKASSWLEIPDDPRHPAPVRLETMVLPTLSPGTRLQRLPLIEIQHKDESLIKAIFHNIENVGLAFKDLFLGADGLLADFDPELRDNLFRTVSHGRIPIVSLKQFRDTVRPDRACYQAIVNAVMEVRKYHGIGLIRGHYVVKMHNYASTPIIEELGLKLSADGTMEPQVAYWLSFDCSIGDGENLYVATPAP